MMTRRRFAFWLGFGLFSLGNKLRVYGLDDLAAAAMRAADPAMSSTTATKVPVHWTAVENKNWRWFEREDFIDGQWKLTGITTPVNKETNEPKKDGTGYLDTSVAPAELRNGTKTDLVELPAEVREEYERHQPSDKRKTRHGRPPSKWLRSLNAEELRIWMKTIDVPEAGVSGMTFMEHLTRDHSFDPVKLEGLTLDEQALLHSAAHFGY